MKLHPLHRNFYNRSATKVAKDLLGKFLVKNHNDSLLVGKIVETEAYLPFVDEAAHGFKGRTKRNSSLYKEGGHAYVHSMRQYCLLDIVAEGEDIPGSVLIRALEPVEGIEEMARNRKEGRVDQLTNGPGKLCAALGVSRELDGVDVTDPSGQLFVAEDNNPIDPKQIIVSTRIGISKAAGEPLRFYLAGNIYVSKGKG